MWSHRHDFKQECTTYFVISYSSLNSIFKFFNKMGKVSVNSLEKIVRTCCKSATELEIASQVGDLARW